MRVRRLELVHLRVPFRRAFHHAGARRAVSDSVFVRAVDGKGREGLGEVQARPYVTGESAEEVMSQDGPALAAELLGRRFESQAELRAWLEETLDRRGRRLAVVAGFESALRQLWAHREPLDEERWIGPRRSTATSRCVTLGLEDDPKELRRLAVAARMAGAAVVKVKVGAAGDRERLLRLDGFFGGRMPLRLDANGGLGLEAARRLLESCRELPIHSLEQPFAADDPELEAKLRELHRSTGVPLVADESLVCLDDARRLAASGVYHLFNLRVGKMGGLRGTVRIAELARERGIGVVAGTMVGESGVLGHASERLLERWQPLAYVEGLGQNGFLLERDPAEAVEAGHGTAFRLRADLPGEWRAAERTFS